jgi:general stress protein YciG
MKSRRGFAAMDPETRRAIASKGSKAVHAKGVAYRFTAAAAAAAGRKGGEAAHARGTAHKFTPDEARAAGRKASRKGGRGARDRARAARVAEAAARQAQAGGRRQGLRPGALARRAEMARLWAAGLSLAEIGARYRITRQAVQRALRAVERAAAAGAEG